MQANPTLRLLVVEDERTIRALYKYMLKGHYEAHIVPTVDEALEMAARERFDLFVLDINLGEDRTGVDLLHLLRRLPGYAQTPALACTAYTMPHERDRILAGGFDRYLSKPFSREQLLTAIGQTTQAAAPLAPEPAPDAVPAPRAAAPAAPAARHKPNAPRHAAA